MSEREGSREGERETEEKKERETREKSPLFVNSSNYELRRVLVIKTPIIKKRYQRKKSERSLIHSLFAFKSKDYC